MAGKSDKSGSKGTVAFAKRAKMDKIQQEILLFVALAAAVIGFTSVGAVFLLRTIAFNAKMIRNQDVVIGTYKGIQGNLEKIEAAITDLQYNEQLESVALQRAEGCAEYYNEVLRNNENDIHDLNQESLNRRKTCTSLRVITDTMPSKSNIEALLSSVNQIMNWSNGGMGVNFEGIQELKGSTVASAGFSAAGSSTMHIINTSVVMDDTSTAIHSALSLIENSIRNIDIVNARIEFDEDTNSNNIKLTSTFASYYSDAASLSRTTRVVCADPDNDACKKAGGDTETAESKSSSSSSKK